MSSYFGAPEDEPGYWDDKYFDGEAEECVSYPARSCDEFKCENGWLVADGVPDNILVTREMAIDAGDRELEGQVYMRLLVPVDYVACSCNPLWSGVGEEVGV